jgi:acetyl-CoA acyltransferase
VTTGRSVVLVAAARSPFGRRAGALAAVHPVDLGAAVVDALLARAGCPPSAVDGVVLGCASPVGEQGLGLARNVARAAGLGGSGGSDRVPGTTVDTQCTAGLRAVQLACDAVAAGSADVVVAGGLESMSRVPYGSALLLGGDPFGARLAERAPGAVPQGVAAERAATKAGLSRAALDDWAACSHERAAAARASSLAAREIVPVGDVTVDEAVARTAESLATHDAAFEPGGVVTAGNAAPMADGAAVVLVVAADVAERLGLTAWARVAGWGWGAADATTLGSAAPTVTGRALAAAGLTVAHVDCCTVGEQYAVVPLAWAQAVGAPLDRVNVHGGALGLGHPVGATGAQLVVSLTVALHAGEAGRGLAVMAGADGAAAVLLVERPGA